jgi:hypothetical protein
MKILKELLYVEPEMFVGIVLFLFMVLLTVLAFGSLLQLILG